MSQNNSQPLVSIGVPVYNGEDFLEECLSSILNQTYQNWVCNINNNGSTDNSLKIAKTYAEKDARFSVVDNEEFVDIVSNWNFAYINSNLKAKYYKIVQADDWIYPEYIERMVDVFERHEGVSMVASYRIDNNRILPGAYHEKLIGEVIEGKELVKSHLKKEIDIVGNITTMLFATEYLKKLDRYPRIFDDKSHHVDTELSLEMMDMGKVGFVQQILSFQRVHAKSSTGSYVYRAGTLYHHYDNILSKYRHLSEKIEQLYQESRRQFAYAFFLMKLKGNKTALDFHSKYPRPPFTFSEKISGILLYNPLTKIIRKVWKKIKR